MAKTVEFVGIGNPRQLDNTNSLSIDFPESAQPGDLLVLQFERGVGNAEIPSIPGDWTIQTIYNIGASNYYFGLATKIMEPGESRVTITFSVAGSLNGVVSAYRNVKSVAGARGRSFSGTSYSPLWYSTFSVAQTDALALIIATVRRPLSGRLTFTPPNGFSQLAEAVNIHNIYHISGKQMGSETSLTPAQTVTTLSREAGGYSALLMVEPFKNTDPTITLSSPADNQTLTEGTTYPIEGTADDADSGNVVTVKYKINNGTARAIASGVSDGISPLSFAKNLTYRNKRLWDGSTDAIGADLAENTDHILTVWTEDDQGGKSDEVTHKFRVIHNRPPSISGTNEDLSTIMVPPSKTYMVTEPEGNPFTVAEKINGTVIRSFSGVPDREETVTIPHELWVRLDLDTPHALTVEATDSLGMTSTRTFTFVRTETHIEFMLNFDNPAVAAHFTPDGMPKRILVTLDRYLPPGASIESIHVCNNALDPEPTWEDATAAVTAGRGYLFTNQTKTADSWRIDIWVVIAKGSATERVRLDGIGGAFD